MSYENATIKLPNVNIEVEVLSIDEVEASSELLVPIEMDHLLPDGNDDTLYDLFLPSKGLYTVKTNGRNYFCAGDFTITISHFTLTVSIKALPS